MVDRTGWKKIRYKDFDEIPNTINITKGGATRANQDSNSAGLMQAEEF